MSAPRRLFLSLAGGRRLHVAISGAGPAVLLIHESPRSMRVLAPIAAELAAHATVVAMDTPGYGLSDPLPVGRPEIVDFAEGAVEAMEALGLHRFGVYGVHTGAQIAAELAAGWPERAAYTILDGFPIFTPEEKAEHLATYLPPFRPDWMGAHVAWAWARVRDQSVFFPWNKTGEGARLGYGPAPLAASQAVLVDLMATGDGYRVGYAGAFRHDAAAVFPGLGGSVLFATREDDMLFSHLDRPAPWPEAAEIRRLPAGRDEAGRLFARLFAERLKGEPAANLRGIADDRLWDAPDGQVWIERSGPESGRGLVLLHDLPGGPEADESLARRLAAAAPLWRVALPGTAQSGRADAWRADPAAVAASVAEALIAAGAEGAAILARGASAALAPRLAAALNAPTVVLVDPPAETPGKTALEEAAPDPAPRWDGGHLHALWWALRDDALYRPGWRREPAAHRPLGDEPDLPRLAARFSAAVVAGAPGIALSRACLADDAWRSATGAPVHVLSTAGATRGEFASETRIAPGDVSLAAAALRLLADGA